MAAALAAHEALHLLVRSTHAYDRLDYQLAGPGDRHFEVELKAKHQRYVGWSQLRPEVAEAHLSLLDELAMSPLVAAGPFGFLLVRDVPGHRWVLWSLAELVVCSKTQVYQAADHPGPGEGQGSVGPLGSGRGHHLPGRCP